MNVYVYVLDLFFGCSIWWAFEYAVMTNRRDEVVLGFCFLQERVHLRHACRNS